ARAVDGEDDRDLRLDLEPGIDHALSHDVGSREGPAEVHEQRLHIRVREHDFQCGDGLRVAVAADFHEVRGLTAEMPNGIHRRHGEAGAVRQHADLAIELYVLQVQRL